MPKQNKSQPDFRDKVILLFMILAVAIGFVFYLSYFKAKPEKSNSVIEGSSVPIISVQEVKQKLDEGQDIIILDTRSREDYQKKHIKGSLSMPQDEIYTRYSSLPQDKEIIVLCYTESCQTSAQVALALLDLGFSNIKDMKEGISGWEKADYPLEGEMVASSTTSQVPISNITIQEVKNKIDTGENIYLVDIREKEDYDQGHLPGAVFIPFDQISKNIEKFPKDKEIIIYDQSGYKSKLTCQYLTGKELKVKNILGGIDAWIEAGYEIIK